TQQDTERASKDFKQLEHELQQARAQIEKELMTRQVLEQQNEELGQMLKKRQHEETRELADTAEQAKEADTLRQGLAQVRALAEEVKAQEAKNTAKIAQLSDEHTTTVRNLEATHSRGEDLEAHLHLARAENEEITKLLEKERVLQAQATEHHRMLQQRISEADVNRTALELQLLTCRQERDDAIRQLKEAQSSAEQANVEARSTREKLAGLEHELRGAKEAGGMLRDNLTLTGRVSQQDFEHRFEESNWLVDQLLDVAVTFWNTHHRALQMLQSMIIAPNGQIDNLGEPGSSPNVHNGSVPQGPPSIDTADAASALQVLRGLDHDNFLDCITKVGSVIKKWQKVCKLHKERAKGKIAFRNFSKGDLALFLPTRNSKVKHWAAFNVSSPHQFLQATGHMEEQLKFREWALCRITTITERVVSRDNPGSLQYGLDDGIKYYVMEVEDWGQQTKEAKKQESSSQEVPTKLD
ncbi:autophagy-related protein 11-domain-containing protein, partial [Scleroderma citrinum]